MWRIPAHRTKMREEHLVPLARQAIEILKELHALTGDGRFVFPAIGYAQRPISDNTINAALRRMGYEQSEMSAHGFRTLASTMSNEMGWAPELIELQLAHKDRNKVRDAYNRAARLAERTELMQAWADHLDRIRAVQAHKHHPASRRPQPTSSSQSFGSPAASTLLSASTPDIAALGAIRKAV